MSLNVSEIYKKIEEDPEFINTLSQSQIEELLKAKNSHIKPNEHESVAITFANMYEKYITRNITTGLIGFLFQYAHEYEPSFENKSYTIKDLLIHNPNLLSGEDFFDSKEKYDDSELVGIIEREVNALKRLQDSKVKYNELKNKTDLLESNLQKSKESISKVDRSKIKSEDGGLDLFYDDIDSIKTTESTIKTYKDNLESINKEIIEIRYNLARFILDNGLEMDRRIDSYADEYKKCSTDPIYDVLDKSVIVPQEFIKNNILAFLKHMFRFDVAKDAVESYDQSKLDLIKKETSQLVVDTKDPMRIPLINIETAISDFKPTNEYLGCMPDDIKVSLLNVINNIPRNNLQDLISDSNYEQTQLELYSLYKDIEPTIKNIPSEDFFAKFSIYYNYYNSRIRDVSNTLYPDKPYFNAMILVHKYFNGDTDKLFDEYCTENYDKFTGYVNNIKFGMPTIINSDINEDTTKFYGGNDDMLRRILDRYENDAKMGDKLMKNKITSNKAESYRRTGAMSESKGTLDKQDNELIKATGGNMSDFKLIKKCAELTKKIKEIEEAHISTGGIMDGITRYRYNVLLDEQKKTMELIKVPEKAVLVNGLINTGKEFKRADVILSTEEL